jgi:hypothetical protein
MKFLVRKGLGISLTPSAIQFVALNKNRTYEISESQKNFLVENLFFEGAWRSHSRGFFLNFSPNYKFFTFEFSIKENPLPIKYNPILQLFKNFRVVEIKDGTIYVNPSYVRFVKDLLAVNKGLTEEQLRKLIDADEELGLLAEEAVLRYERKRLLNLERIPEMEIVRRVSQLNANAGYDIASFDGDVPSLTNDRFIEVKASKQSKIRFYWSSNEYEKAQELGDKYWIYFIGGFKENQTEVIPIMIRNPVKRIPELIEMKMRVAKYVVEATKDLLLIPIPSREVKGWLL